MILKIKKIFSRIFTGLKKGIFTPTVPEHILNIQIHPLVRIFRFLGGVSLLYILGRSYLPFNIYGLYFALAFSIMFLIYHIIVTFYRIKHIIKIFKNNDLDIRNSPRDKMATLIAKAIFCAKGACDSAQPVGATLGIMLGVDEVLAQADRPKIFGPFLGKMLNGILPEKNSSRILTSLEVDKKL